MRTTDSPLRQTLHSLPSGLIVLTLLGGAALLARGDGAASAPRTSRSPVASAIEFEVADDDPCNPKMPVSYNASGTSGSGPSVSGQAQAAPCPPVNFNMLPMTPRDPCPEPQPCYYPPGGMGDVCRVTKILLV